MIKNQLLKEAIAEAETIRQVALENAKISLEENFTPAIKTMMARKLQAESAGEDEADDEEKKKKAAPEQPELTEEAPTAEKAKEVEGGESEPVGSSEMPADDSTIGAGDNKEPSDASTDSSDIGPGPEAGDGENSDGWYEDWTDGDFDLDEIIKELEEDVATLAKKEYPDVEPESSKEPKGKTPAAPLIKKEADEEDAKEPEAKPEVEPKAEPAAPVSEPAVTPEPTAEPSAPVAEPSQDADEDDLDLEAVIRELEAGESQPDSNVMASELERLKSELAEYRKAFELLRGKLQEVNLLNAKLFYTNRLISKNGLTDEQKVAIFENIDRAVDVRGVKMVYTALIETLTATARSLKGRPVKRAITEGLASRPTPSTAPKAELIVEESALAKRFKQLAGLI